MKKYAKSVVAVLLVCLMVLSLAACGNKVDPELLGKYNLVSCVYMDMELGADDEWIELQNGGRATMDLNDGDGEFLVKYAIDGTTFTLTDAEGSYTGTIENNAITLDLDGMILTFAKEGSDEEAALRAAAEQAEEDDFNAALDEAYENMGRFIGSWTGDDGSAIAFYEDATGVFSDGTDERSFEFTCFANEIDFEYEDETVTMTFEFTEGGVNLTDEAGNTVSYTAQ